MLGPKLSYACSNRADLSVVERRRLELYIPHYLEAEKLILKNFTLFQVDKFLLVYVTNLVTIIGTKSFHDEIDHIKKDPFWTIFGPFLGHFWDRGFHLLGP